MNRETLFRLDLTLLIHRLPKDVHQATQCLGPDRHQNGITRIDNLHSTHQSIR